MSNKHFRPDEQPVKLTDDLERNPGIGQSGGLFARTGEDPSLIEGDNTFEGDVENDASVGQAAAPSRLGRTNK